MSTQHPIPPTPRVISPSPTLSEVGSRDGYFPPQTRSKSTRLSSVEPIEENADDDDEAVDSHAEDPELARARARSRSPQLERRPTRTIVNGNGGITTSAKASMPSAAASKPHRRKKDDANKPADIDPKAANGFLSPASAYTQGYGSSYWRNLSRSPSPLGLIPIHREWRAFVHKHEVPRKLLHVSIGFLTLFLYYEGLQADQIHPILLGLLIPIFSIDLIRFRWPAFNRLYIRSVGAFMRESEAHDRFNGVISYLAGLWVTMRFCPKDVAVMSVLLLSWCDTAASTFGRLWGKYTPRIRRGRSLAGSIACFVFGVATAVLFYGLVAPTGDASGINTGPNAFAYRGHLTLPPALRERFGCSEPQATISGPIAVGVLALVSGLAASVSEAIDLWGLDDNLTIPILCGAELAAFLSYFGGR